MIGPGDSVKLRPNSHTAVENPDIAECIGRVISILIGPTNHKVVSATLLIEGVRLKRVPQSHIELV